MNLVKVISILCILLIYGCTTTKIEYRDVYIPTKVEIDKPNRPKYTDKDNTYTYLVKVLGYTKKLETIIEGVTK